MGALANAVPSISSAFELAIGLSLLSAVLHACVSVIMKRSDDKLFLEWCSQQFPRSFYSRLFLYCPFRRAKVGFI